MCVKHLFAKHALLGDLRECHHLEIATLRLHLGFLGVFSDRNVNIQLYCSMTVLLKYFIA